MELKKQRLSQDLDEDDEGIETFSALSLEEERQP